MVLVTPSIRLEVDGIFAQVLVNFVVDNSMAESYNGVVLAFSSDVAVVVESDIAVVLER